MAKCIECEKKGFSFVKYNEGYDAYYCGICDKWLEGQCSDPECEYCVGRPNKPSDLLVKK